MPLDGTQATTATGNDGLTMGQTVARLAQEIAVLEPGTCCSTSSWTAYRRGVGGVLEAAHEVRP